MVGRPDLAGGQAVSSPNRVLIAAGGTGGHFYPGLVLAQALRGRGWEPLMLLRANDPAAARLESEGVASAEIDLRGLSRRPGPDWAVFAWKLAKALGRCSRILRDFEPRVVVGMGGYLTFPAVLAARLRGAPCAVHESNAILGLANRASVALGAALFRGLPPAGKEPAGLLTGTPVRPTLYAAGDPAQARLRLGLDPAAATVLVFGGSQGAQGINGTAPRALAQAARACPEGLQVLHLAGVKTAAVVTAAYAAEAAPGLRVKVEPYLDAMDLAYAAADLVVCRAGASTIAELACQRKPAILVPYPHATGRHQDANARLLVEAGAARLVSEELLAFRLAGELSDLLSSEKAHQRRAGMSAAYGRLGLPIGEQVVGRLADAVEAVCRT